MNRKAYIELLASSPLPKSAIDKDTPEIKPPEFISNYEQAVLNGFKWSEAYFEKKYKIHDKLYSEISNITKAIESLKLEQNTTTASIFWEVKQDIENIQNTLSGINEELGDEKALANKRINDTNEKIEKKYKQAESKIIDLYPQINNLQSSIKEVEESILENETNIFKKIDIDYKELSISIDENRKQLEDTITKNKKNTDKELKEKVNFEEVKNALDEFYTKDETYSKREIDNKLESLPSKSVTNIIRWWSATSWPVYAPFVTVTNAERELLMPDIWRIVYCTDEIEWLYLYTSQWRQIFNTILVQ